MLKRNREVRGNKYFVILDSLIFKRNKIKDRILYLIT